MTKDHESTFRVHVEGELVLITTKGSQSPDAIRSIRQKVETLLADRHGPKDLLVDSTKAAPPTRQSMELALTFLHEVPFRRMAIFGSNPDMLLVARTLLNRSGSEKFKVFRDEHMARAWLKEASHPVRAKLEQKKDRILRRHADSLR